MEMNGRKGKGMTKTEGKEKKKAEKGFKDLTEKKKREAAHKWSAL